MYPISVVSQKTGISPHVIRKWELRYGFPAPGRTESNRRLYSDYDIALLQKAISMKSQGFRIQDIVGILNSHKASGIHDANEPDISGEFFEAVSELNRRKVRSVLETALSVQGLPAFLFETIIPVLKETGRRWADGSINIYNEHFLSSIIRFFLTGLVEDYPPNSSAPAVICCTLPDQKHEFGILIAAVLLRLRGFRILHLGSEVPVDDIHMASEKHNPVAVFISETGDYADNRKQMIEALAQRLPCRLVVGTGRADIAAIRSPNVSVLTDLRDILEMRV